jgi:hypothetical protein
LRDLSQPVRCRQEQRGSRADLEWWTCWSPEVSDCQLLEQSQKAFMKKTILVSEDTHKKLKEYCKKEGIKSQHLTDKIIREWLDKEMAT